PQDIATGSSPTFAGLLLNGDLDVTGTVTIPLDCTGNLNGGALTTNGSGQIVCSNDEGGGGGGAPTDATYLVAALNAALTDERALASGSNIQFTDGGANGSFTIATVQNPTFTTSVTTPLLTSTGAMNITPGGALTVGAVGQTVLLQGSTSTITSSAGNDIVLNSGDTINLQDNTIITGTLNVSSTVTGGTYNGQTISAAASLTGTLSVATSVTTPSLIFTGAGSNGNLQVANLGQSTTYTLPDPGQATADICLSTGNCVGGSGGAPNNAAYLTVGNNATLSGERAIAVNATNLSFTDGGADGSYTINTIQNIATTSTPTFGGLTLNGNLILGTNTLQGTTAAIDFTNFDVTSGGAVTAVGVNAGTGLIQGTGGLTVTGAIT
ncbi:MAG: beta strand repeat-containing protein, partial [Acidobacteriota bacterium]